MANNPAEMSVAQLHEGINNIARINHTKNQRPRRPELSLDGLISQTKHEEQLEFLHTLLDREGKNWITEWILFCTTHEELKNELEKALPKSQELTETLYKDLMLLREDTITPDLVNHVKSAFWHWEKKPRRDTEKLHHIFEKYLMNTDFNPDDTLLAAWL